MEWGREKAVFAVVLCSNKDKEQTGREERIAVMKAF